MYDSSYEDSLSDISHLFGNDCVGNAIWPPVFVHFNYCFLLIGSVSLLSGVSGCCGLMELDAWSQRMTQVEPSLWGWPFCLGVYQLHPGRLTWNLQITHLERKMIFQTSMIMVHVNLPGCSSSCCCFFSFKSCCCFCLISRPSMGVYEGIHQKNSYCEPPCRWELTWFHVKLSLQIPWRACTPSTPPSRLVTGHGGCALDCLYDWHIFDTMIIVFLQ